MKSREEIEKKHGAMDKEFDALYDTSERYFDEIHRIGYVHGYLEALEFVPDNKAEDIAETDKADS